MVPIQTILLELNMELKLQGKPYLSNMKMTGNNIMCSCPYHGKDKHPSFGILIREHNGVPAGTFSCLACHKSGSLSKLISYLLYGKEDDVGTYGDNYLIEHYADYELDNRETAFKLPCRKSYIDHTVYISEDELSKYRFIHPYITNKRGISENVLDIFDVGYDKDFKLNNNCNSLSCITFPVRDVEGNCLFVARRSVRGKLFHYPDSVQKPLYGLWELCHMDNWEDTTLYITESIINCLSLWSAGYYAIALNGTGSAEQIEEIKRLPNRNIILALDTGDYAGLNGTHKLIESLKNYKMLHWLQMPDKVDINDLWVVDKKKFTSKLPNYLRNAIDIDTVL